MEGPPGEGGSAPRPSRARVLDLQNLNPGQDTREQNGVLWVNKISTSGGCLCVGKKRCL